MNPIAKEKGPDAVGSIRTHFSGGLRSRRADYSAVLAIAAEVGKVLVMGASVYALMLLPAVL